MFTIHTVFKYNKFPVMRRADKYSKGGILKMDELFELIVLLCAALPDNEEDILSNAIQECLDNID